MQIILDTNIIYADFLMKGTAFRIFLSEVQRIGAMVYFPEVVLDEIYNKYRQELIKVSESLQRDSDAWRRITGNELNIFDKTTDVEKQVDWYRKYIKEKIESIRAKTISYPRISHKKIVLRLQENKPPFRPDGKGYRDTLIWQSIFESLLRDKNNEKIYFITNDKQDFGDGPRFRTDIEQEIIKAGHATDKLVLIRSLEQLNNELIMPVLKRLDDMIDRFSKNTVAEFSLQDWVEKKLVDLLNEEEWDIALVGIEPGHSSGYLSVRHINSVEVDDVRQLSPSGDILLASTADLDMGLNIYGNPDEYYEYEDVRHFWGYEEIPNESSSATIDVTAKVAFSLVLEKGSFDILSAEIDQIDSNLASIEVNPHIKKPA